MMTEIDNVPLPETGGWKFIDELKQPEIPVFAWTGAKPGADLVDLSLGIVLVSSFPDPACRLDSAYDDLHSFFRHAGLNPNGPYAIITEYGFAGPFDSFRLVVTKENCRIIAENTEGIRRGIFYLEDLLAEADGPFLSIGEIRRNAWLKNRISRCFFGPIKRPPMNRDELADNVDYYPEAYLNRLAHEGVNGLWLTVELKDISRTEFTPDGAPDAEKRLAKLKRTVEKCLRYGIKTYIFMIEPAAWKVNDPLLRKFPELGGAPMDGSLRCFCPSSAAAQRFLYQSVNYIFRRIPELGGIINISLGERATTCLSSIPIDNSRLKHELNCPRCAKKTRSEVVFNTIDPMVRGMRDAAPEADFICWYYLPLPQEQPDWTFELTHLPENTILMYNFESGGKKEQLGKMCVAGDYWLSYVGPSENFEKMARMAHQHGVGMGAKLQVSSSHELATVPYIPVPGQLYRKYAAIKKLGANTVMQCWYFGNHPGLMNKAAGMLAFEDFNAGEDDFLMRLARPLWNKNAGIMTRIWKKTSAAFRNYPFSNRMQYYGPFHCGVVWPLFPSKQYLPLSPTWKIGLVSGDTIGECLDNHSLAEAVDLVSKMSDSWHEATQEAASLRIFYEGNPERSRDIDLIEAIDLLFRSAKDILLFYWLRETSRGFSAEMHNIIEQEIAISERMAVLCEKDPRLGFHSEAENYVFYPEKLKARVAFLKKIQKTPEVQAVDSFPQIILGQVCKADNFTWKLFRDGEDLKLQIRLEGDIRDDQICIHLAQSSAAPLLLIDFYRNGSFIPSRQEVSYKFLEKHPDKWAVEFTIPPSIIPAESGLRISLVRYMRGNCVPHYDSSPKMNHQSEWRLNLGLYHPKFMYIVS